MDADMQGIDIKSYVLLNPAPSSNSRFFAKHLDFWQKLCSPSLDITAENVIYLIRCIRDSILESGHKVQQGSLKLLICYLPDPSVEFIKEV